MPSNNEITAIRDASCKSGTYADSEGPDQTAHAQSDLGLRCPLHYCQILEMYRLTAKIRIILQGCMG